MLFSGKSNGYFVEINEYSTLVARTSSSAAPLVVEKVEELAAGTAGLATAFEKIAGPRRGGYRHAVIGISPERRFVRRASIDQKRGKDTAALEELLVTQFRAEPEKMMIAILSAADGSNLDAGLAAGKEVLFCGGYTEDFAGAQKTLLEAGVFPESLELTSVATLGGMQGLLALQENKSPVLVLEVGRESTHCYIVNANGVDLARPIPHGINSMIPVAQKELGLRDEEAAAKLLFSNTFDFTGMGPNLVKRLLKELQSSIGFFEVQTGQSIGQLCCSVLPPAFSWLSGTLANALGVSQLQSDLKPWAEKQGIKFAAGLCNDGIPAHWMGLLSLIAKHQPVATTK
ncbi:MAG TPA: hypothetical protein VK178_03670 [Opitutaceae bacterium]|nr:hypothetical protein [Opitutaceae bacterium]